MKKKAPAVKLYNADSSEQLYNLSSSEQLYNSYEQLYNLSSSEQLYNSSEQLYNLSSSDGYTKLNPFKPVTKPNKSSTLRKSEEISVLW